MYKSTRKKYVTKVEALQKMQRYCAYQDRCHQEVRSKLLELGIYGDELEEVIVELITESFLDEERFARSFARGKFRMKQWGRLRIQRELKQRQLSDYCLRKAMEEIEENEYQDTLLALLKKKNQQLDEPESFKRKAKLAQFAQQRGFEVELIWQLLNHEEFSET